MTIHDRFSRQSFLGPNAQKAIERTRVGIVGAGGGGSHIVQQLSHVGFLHYVLYDSQISEESNLNRLVTATEEDVEKSITKVESARRRIMGVRSTAIVEAIVARWQDDPDPLRRCDIVFGTVDTFAERRELEAFCRRYMIPLIDIGMDVHEAKGQPSVMSGQVILSMPGGPCMFCLGFLNDENLTREASLYGAAGPRPQVVWPNGVLASTAVGIAIDLLTDWTQSMRDVVYLSYRGNTGTIAPHVRLKHLSNSACEHYPISAVGDPVLVTL